MKIAISAFSRFFAPVLLSLSVSTAAFTQDVTQTADEKKALENLYAIVLIMEFCADLGMFFDDETVEDSKLKSKEIIQSYSLSEAEKDKIWEYAEKETREALRKLNAADYAQKFGFCETIRSFHKETFLTHDSQPTPKD